MIKVICGFLAGVIIAITVGYLTDSPAVLGIMAMAAGYALICAVSMRD